MVPSHESVRMAVERRFLPFAHFFLAPALGCDRYLLVRSLLYPSQRLMVLREMHRRKVALSEEVALLEEAQRKVEEDSQ